MQIEEGAVFSGKVTGITDFGAFVDIGGGKTGMVHISEISNGFIKDIREHLSQGQNVKVKVISVSPEGKVSLSIRRAEPDSETVGSDTSERKPKRFAGGSASKVWTGNKPAENSDEKKSFEDMMASFKKVSDEKMSDLKRADSKRGSIGYSRRGKN